MKNIFFILTLLAIGTIACNKVLDVKPTDSIPDTDAISTPSGADRALTGAYNALQSTGLYGRNLIVIGDLSADNLSWTGTTLDYGQLDIIPVPSDNSIIDGIWAASYDGINRVNNILYFLPGIDFNTEAEKNVREGEALFLRSLLYFNLVQYFGPVPFKLQPTHDLTSIDVARTDVKTIYDQLLADLDKAYTQLPADRIKGRAGKYAAGALIARINLNLFHKTGTQAYAAAAINALNDVIDNSGCTLDPVYTSLFGPEGFSSESIFEVSFDVVNYNRLAQYFFSRDLSGRYEFAPTASLVGLFENESVRKPAALAYDKNNLPFGNKYFDVAGGADRVYVFRLAEMFLLRAEAYAYSSNNTEQVMNDINMVRTRAGLPAINSGTMEELKTAIENECRIEFAFEGHRWNDLVRTGRAVQVLAIDPKYTIFPVPLSEMTTNKLIGDQNEGY